MYILRLITVFLGATTLMSRTEYLRRFYRYSLYRRLLLATPSYVIYGLCVARALAVVYSVSTGDERYFDWDPLASSIHRRQQYPAALILSFIPIFGYIIFSFHTTVCGLPLSITQTLHQLVNTNFRLMCEDNPTLANFTKLNRTWKLSTWRIKTWNGLLESGQLKFCQPISGFEFLSPPVRIRLLQVSDLISLIDGFGNLSLGLITSFIFIPISIAILSSLFSSNLLIAIIVLDELLLIAHLAIVFEIGLFLCESLVVLSALVSGVVGELVGSMRQVTTRTRVPAMIVAYRLHQFRQTHHTLLQLVLTFNTLFSPCSFCFFSANLIFNAFCVSFIYFNPQIPLIELLVFYTVCFAQILAAGIFLWPTRSTNRSLIHSTQPLHQFMLHVHSRTSLPVGTRLRFQTCYENAHHSTPIGYTFGPIGPFNLNRIFEIMIFYIVYLLYLISLQQKQRLEMANKMS